MPLPLPHDVERARPRARTVAAHAFHDLLRERDPQLLVVDEVGVALEVRDRGPSRIVVALGLEAQAVASADPAVALRPELRPGPEQREVDVEQNGLEHGSEDTGSRSVRFAPRGVAQPGSALRSGRRGPQFKSGHPDSSWGKPCFPREPPSSALPPSPERAWPLGRVNRPSAAPARWSLRGPRLVSMASRDEIVAYADALLEIERFPSSRRRGSR